MTGVQTCALPIFGATLLAWGLPRGSWAERLVGVLTFGVGGVAPAYFFSKRVKESRTRFRELNLKPLL